MCSHTLIPVARNIEVEHCVDVVQPSSLVRPAPQILIGLGICKVGLGVSMIEIYKSSTVRQNDICVEGRIVGSYGNIEIDGEVGINAKTFRLNEEYVFLPSHLEIFELAIT